MTTDKDLVELLQQRNTNGRYDKLIAQAANGDFHDFKTQHALPKLMLVSALDKFHELSDIREAVINGDYDEPFPL
jgi:hypothetical protein